MGEAIRHFRKHAKVFVAESEKGGLKKLFIHWFIAGVKSNAGEEEWAEAEMTEALRQILTIPARNRPNQFGHLSNRWWRKRR